MTVTGLRVGVLAAGLAGACGLAVAADPPAADPAAPDFSGYTFVSDVVGEVVKATDTGFTLRVTWYVPVGNGGRGARPRLSGNHRNFHNPYASRGRRGGSSAGVHLKEEHHDYELEFAPGGLVRFKAPPPKTDAAGKKVEYTAKELDDLKQPPGVRGYAGKRADLTAGTVVEAIVVRDKTIPAAKATEADLRVKYAVVLGPKPAAPAAKNSPAKDKDQ